MSVTQIALVFRRSRSKGSARLVLLALADVANDEGEITAYARSQKILAAKANVDQGSVRRAIDKLEELGELKVLRQGDGRHASDYQLLLGEIEGAQPAAPAPAERAPRPGETRAQGAQVAAPITPSLPGVDPSPPDSRAEPVLSLRLDAFEPEPFEEFWKAYPRHVAKGAARKAWPSAVASAGATEPIIEGARRYAEERRGEPEKFTAHPASWLRSERWGDEPARRQQRSGPRGPIAQGGPEGRVADL